MKHYQTLKLFYKKYPYKLNLRVPIAYALRGRKIEKIAERVIDYPNYLDLYGYGQKKHGPFDKSRFIEFIQHLRDIDPTLYKIRIEHNTVNLYVETKELLDKLCSRLHTFVRGVYEPSDQSTMEFMLEHEKKVLVKRLPHGRYTHKIVLKQLPDSVRENLNKWVNHYSKDVMLVSKSTKKWLEGRQRWCWNPFIYVSDPKTLTMLGLATQGYISRTEQFVPLSSINTVS